MGQGCTPDAAALQERSTWQSGRLEQGHRGVGDWQCMECHRALLL